MSVRPVTFYEVVCDEPGCEFKTLDMGHDFAAFSDPGSADDDWIAGDLQRVDLPNGDLHYCDRHRRPACYSCGEPGPDLQEDEPGGDWSCADCRAEAERTERAVTP